jgi:ribosomal protein S18 acetylase RimI-like enzyme
MSNIVIINYSENLIREHIDELINIDKEAFSAPYDSWTLDNFLYVLPDKDKLSFIILDDNKAIGFLIASSYANISHLNRIAISNKYRGKSFGKVLVNKFLEESQKLGFIKTTLNTLYDVHHNYVIKFYENLGYKIVLDKNSIILFLALKDKIVEFDKFYPPLIEGKFIIMEKI